MSFTLSIKNAPSGSYQWWADYSQGSVYSGWLDISQTWSCPYGAYGYTDLHIWVVDSNYNTKHDKYNLGPVYDNKNYIYDCSTGVLSEAGAQPVGGWSVLKTIDVNLGPSEVIVGGWNVLKTVDITLAPSEVVVGGWNVLKTVDITLAPKSAVEFKCPYCGQVFATQALLDAHIASAHGGGACSVDADCPAGYVCKSGKCVKKEETDWTTIAIVGLIGLAVVVIATTIGRKK